MSNQEIKHSAKEILNKDFKTGMRGYNQDEVDKFLDSIIQDYELFQKKIEQLEQENQQLRKENKKLQDRPSRQAQPAAPSNNNTNYDILQRLSNLEKKVFGSKMYE
ncbi:cell division regulator GpsB [Alkalicoccobacillus porphyridii]|uniref:Cell division regulator GpsB n=1 Tax=Alkalicoccobacillus porphyridii TaxID=2597270 RepID=A0A553ZZY2_9BACI|nr:cell division regulator GpsB [Alkalicoccobacillus porphyridii]TSB47007.1 cell division regulator GpsB [Alkalicoccobacillus porphyridii]